MKMAVLMEEEGVPPSSAVEACHTVAAHHHDHMIPCKLQESYT